MRFPRSRRAPNCRIRPPRLRTRCHSHWPLHDCHGHQLRPRQTVQSHRPEPPPTWPSSANSCSSPSTNSRGNSILTTIIRLGCKCTRSPSLSLIPLPLPSASSNPQIAPRSFARAGEPLPARAKIVREAQRNVVASRRIAPSISLGYSDAQAMNYGTLPSQLLNAVDTKPNACAQMLRRPAAAGSESSRWEAISSAELLRRIAGFSTALVELGVKSGDRVGLFSPNRPEWHVADFAITGAGGATVPIYFNESPERMAYILNHAQTRVVFAAGAMQAKRLLENRHRFKTVEHIIVAEGGPDVPAECLQYDALLRAAGDADVATYRVRASQILPGQLASIIYTSGTTGEPKGVMLTHTNLCSNVT